MQRNGIIMSIKNYFVDINITIQCDTCKKNKDIVFQMDLFEAQDSNDVEEMMFNYFSYNENEKWIVNNNGKHCCDECIKKIDKEREKAEALKNEDFRLDFSDGSPLFG